MLVTLTRHPALAVAKQLIYRLTDDGGSASWDCECHVSRTLPFDGVHAIV